MKPPKCGRDELAPCANWMVANIKIQVSVGKVNRPAFQVINLYESHILLTLTWYAYIREAYYVFIGIFNILKMKNGKVGLHFTGLGNISHCACKTVLLLHIKAEMAPLGKCSQRHNLTHSIVLNLGL